MELPPKNPGSAPFIVATTLAKPDPQTRKFIRSHVMRGKNAGRPRAAKKLPLSQGEAQPPPRGQRQRRKRSRSGSGSGPPKTPQVPEVVVAQEPVAAPEGVLKGEVSRELTTPRRIAADLSLIRLGTELEPYCYELIYRAFTVVKPAIYPLHDTIGSALHEDHQMFWMANIAQNPGILHTTLFASQAYHDLSHGCSYSTVARLHLGEALRHVQGSLNNTKEAVQLSTVAVVMALAMTAVICGDMTTAARHIDGLHRILQLRGGLRSLGPGSPFAQTIRTLDLGLAIALGTELRFMQDSDVPWTPELARGLSAERFPELSDVLRWCPHRPDRRLLHVWADLRELSRLLNEGFKLPSQVSANLAASVPFRLLRLRMKDDDAHAQAADLHELLRLCMLACAKVLLVGFQNTTGEMTLLADGLSLVLKTWHSNLESSMDEIARAAARKLLLWGLFVASVSVFREGDNSGNGLSQLLVRTVSNLGLGDWTKVRALLKGFLWIDIAFDKPAEIIFERRCKPAVSHML